MNIPFYIMYGWLLFMSTIVYTSDINPPKLTVIFVIDQCPFDALSKTYPYMHGGIKQLIDQGINYNNAHHPHSTTATCTGHTALGTGAFANEHGITGNGWYNQHGKKVACDDDDSSAAAVFSPEGIYTFGKSPHFIMVDGISDQFILNGSPQVPHHAVSISNKSRSAIATGSRASAFWFDDKSGRLTSSKAYFDTLPAWVQSFNEQYSIPSPSTLEWKQCYDNSTNAYFFSHVDDYRFVRLKSLVNKTIEIGSDKKNPYANFELSPHANTFLFNAALTCAKEYVSSDKPDRMLLWICLSSLDKIGHRFGPWSREYLDTLYHLDIGIGLFMKQAEQLVGKDNVLFVLTSDHGVPPLIEYIHEKGLHDLGTKINPKLLIQEINNFVEEKYHVKNLIHATTNQQLYFNRRQLYSVPLRERHTLIKDISHFLERIPGIKKAWTPHTLLTRSFPTNSQEFYFQQQVYSGRTGQIILQMRPFSLIMEHKHGISHRTPHTYNTHVPLIIYGHSYTKPQKIYARVLTLQLANTLAALLKIPQPSSSYMDILPHVFPE